MNIKIKNKLKSSSHFGLMAMMDAVGDAGLPLTGAPAYTALMQANNRNAPLKRLTALLLLFTVCLSLIISSPTHTFAKEVSIEDKASKVSPEFSHLDKDFQADAILQLNGPMSQALSDFIKRNISIK